MFIGTEHRGLYSTNFNGDSPVKEPIDLPTNRIFTLHVDKWKNLYVGAEASPVWVLNVSSGVKETNSLRSPFEGKIIYSAIEGSAMLELETSVDQVISIDFYDILGKKYQSIHPTFYPS